MGANKMFNINSRKKHDDYDTDQLWRSFKNNKKKTHFNVPTINEAKEVYKLLKSNKKELYTINCEECERKRAYWEEVLEVYKENDFIMPHSFRLGNEIKFKDIWDYYITQNEINLINEIIRILKEDEDDYFIKEHISFT